jgi:hypothetical protein
MKTYHNTNMIRVTNLEIDPSAGMSDFYNETVTMDVSEIIDKIISDIENAKQYDKDSSELSTVVASITYASKLAPIARV